MKRDFGSPRLDFAVVPDMTVPGAFDEALSKTDEPFDGVVGPAALEILRSDRLTAADPYCVAFPVQSHQ